MQKNEIQVSEIFELENIIPEKDEYTVLSVLPSAETRYFRGRANLIYSPVCFSKVSKNINDIVLATAAKAYIQNKRINSFVLRMSLKDIALKIGVPFDNKNIYKHVHQYIKDLERYKYGSFTVVDKITGNIETINLITKVEYINNAGEEEDRFFRSYGSYLKVRIQDAFLLELKGDAAEMDMLYTRKLKMSLSQHMYDYFSLQKYLVIIKNKPGINTALSENHFRFLFCINRNDQFIDTAIKNENNMHRDNPEEYYLKICNTAKVQKKAYLKQLEMYEMGGDVSEETMKSIKRAAQEVYPYDNFGQLCAKIKDACKEISEKTDISVYFQYAKDFKEDNILSFTIAANKSNMKLLEGDRDAFEKMYGKEYPGADTYVGEDAPLSFNELKKLLFEIGGESSVRNTIIENEEDVLKIAEAKPGRKRKEGDGIEIEIEKPEKEERLYSNINDFMDDEELDYYQKVIEMNDNQIPYEYMNDKEKMTRCIMFLADWDYFVDATLKKRDDFQPDLDNPVGIMERVRVVINVLADMATADINTKSVPVIKKNVVLDRLNEQVRLFNENLNANGVYKMIPLRTYVMYLEGYYKEILLDPDIKNKKAYLRSCIWNDYDEWALKMKSENYDFQKSVYEYSEHTRS